MTDAGEGNSDRRHGPGAAARGRTVVGQLMRKLEQLHLLDIRVRAARPGSPEYRDAAQDLDDLSQSLIDEFRRANRQTLAPQRAPSRRRSLTRAQ